MQVLTIRIDDDYLEIIIGLLKKIPKNKIKIIDNDKVEKKSNVFGLLKNRIDDPVKWQRTLRAENDRDIYSEIK